MQYRPFGKTGVSVSALGFGTMRLPLRNGEQGSSSYGENQVDAEQTIQCLRYAVDHGVNYIDTAYNYMGGNSERIVGQALRDGYRQRVYVATKSPVWILKGPGDFDRILDEQLRRLQTDQIDMYLLHTLTAEYVAEIVEPFGVLEALARAKADGRVRYVGFSFHDELPVFRRILDMADWDFCQIQLNYVDVRHQAGLEGLHAAAARNMGVSIMEPLRGGYLVHPPQGVTERFAALGKNPVQFALEYLWNLPEVSVVLSGMGTMEQLKENLSYAEQAGRVTLDPRTEETAAEARRIIYAANQIGCTGCRYCEGGCPQGIPISGIFRDYYVYTNGNDDAAKNSYRDRKEQSGANARDCIGCRQCEEICPQHISVVDWLKKADALLR